jgi:hypothetical protein
MDPPEHTVYRKIIEPYFSYQRMLDFEPLCREVVTSLLKDRLKPQMEFMSEVALPFAVRVQCAFLGWPQKLHATLLDWITRSQEATFARDRNALSETAREFEAIIDQLVDERRQTRAGPHLDVTSALMHEQVNGRPLTNEELSSILRNWTAGEIGTISAAIGILAAFLAEHHDLQTKLRSDRSLLPYAIDEILRIHGPLVANRRVTKCPVKVGKREIPAGERISINWVAANRDENAFEDPTSFRFDRDTSKNLLYGAGIHVCPGAPLASLEMRILMEELLSRTVQIAFDSGAPTFAVYPSSGFSKLPLRVQTADI